jgi:hypothetical protein
MLNKTILSQKAAATPEIHVHRCWLEVVYRYFSNPEERALTARAYRDLEKAGLDRSVVDGAVEYLVHHGLFDSVVDDDGMYLYGGDIIHLWRHLSIVPASREAHIPSPAYYRRLLASVRKGKECGRDHECGERGA